MENTIATLTSLIPTDLEFAAMLKFIVIFAFVTVFIGLLGRVVFGIRSDLNHALSSAMGILFVYAVTIVIYTFNPQNLARFLAPLPFVTFTRETLYLFSFRGAGIDAICNQVLSMFILALLVNLLDTFIPKGKKILPWYLLRLVTVILALVLHALLTWVTDTYVPGVLAQYAPIALLLIFAAMLLMGLSKVVLGAVLTIANPIIGAIYTFFFANIIGKQLSKSALTTIVLCILVAVLQHFGYAAIAIGVAALSAYIPLIITLLILWYLIGHVL